MPLIRTMSPKRIVGLGEGTHGTSEFYKLRYWISRILIEEYSYNYIGFENDFGDVWQLNQNLNDTTDLKTSMKKYIYSIWQKEEVLEFLEWVRSWNINHKTKVIIAGVDYALIETDVNVLLKVMQHDVKPEIITAVKQLQEPAFLQDQLWEGKYKTNFREDMLEVRKKSSRAYKLADSIEKIILADSFPLSVKKDCAIAIANIKQGVGPFHHRTEESERDSIMAANVKMHLTDSGDKMIVWAHNAHLSKKAVYDNSVGGMGGFLLKLYPDNYFVIGTGTAEGPYTGTREPKPTNNNKMETFKLESPVKDSWEQLFKSNAAENFYIMTNSLPEENKPTRFVGYGRESGKGTYDKASLASLYDGYIFIRDTHAGKQIQ